MFLANKYKIVLFSVLVFFGLLTVFKPAQAIIGTGLFDYVDTALNALDFIDQAVLGFLTKLILLAFGSSAFVILSAHLLEWAFQLSINLTNPTVLAGWYFILGLVNLFFILSLVFIALAYILKIESLQLKKALPRLIIVILLVNFSLLIIGIFVDIAQFFMNTFLGAFGADFVTMAILPLRSSLGMLLNVLMVTITGYVASAFTVFGSVFSMVWILNRLFGGDLLGSIFAMIVLIALNLVMGAIFFVYAVLFVLRIAVLWLLAIFSPLAFFALVFPQTKQYATRWLKQVIQWAFLGVVAFFLLGLITLLFSQAFLERPGEINISAMAGLPAFQLPESVYNYLFLIIFLFIAFKASLKYVPEGAQQAIGLMKGQLAAMGGVGGIISKAKRGISKGARRVVPEGVKRKMQKWATTPTRGRALMSPYVKRRIGKGVSSATIGADRQAFAQEEKKASEQDVISNMHAFSSTHDPTKQAAILSAMRKNKQIKDAMDDKIVGKGNTLLDQRRAVELAHRQAARLNLKDVKQGIERNFAKDLGGEFEKNLIADGLYTKDDAKADRAKGYASYGQKIIAEANTADKIRELQKDWYEEPDLIEGFHKSSGGHQIGEASRTFGKEFTDVLEKTKKSASWYAINNPGALRFYASSGAQNLGLSSVEGAETREEIKDRIKGAEGAREEMRRIARIAEGAAKEKITEEKKPTEPPKGRREMRGPQGGRRGVSKGGRRGV